MMREPSLFRGLIYLSPVMEDECFVRREFSSPARGRRILVLHGDNDDRIPQRRVKAAVAILKDMGCHVQAKFYEHEDHFLLFSKPNAVLEDIMAFMNADGG